MSESLRDLRDKVVVAVVDCDQTVLGDEKVDGMYILMIFGGLVLVLSVWVVVIMMEAAGVCVCV